MNHRITYSNGRLSCQLEDEESHRPTWLVSVALSVEKQGVPEGCKRKCGLNSADTPKPYRTDAKTARKFGAQNALPPSSPSFAEENPAARIGSGKTPWRANFSRPNKRRLRRICQRRPPGFTQPTISLLTVSPRVMLFFGKVLSMTHYRMLAYHIWCRSITLCDIPSCFII